MKNSRLPKQQCLSTARIPVILLPMNPSKEKQKPDNRLLDGYPVC